MTSRWLLAILIAGLPATLLAQAKEPAALVELKAELAAGLEQQKAATQALMETAEYKKAVADRDRDAINKLRAGIPGPDRAALGKKALAAASAAKGEEAMTILSWTVTALRHQASTQAAVEVILKDHMKSPQLADFVESGSVMAGALGPEAAEKALQAIVEGTDQSMAKAWALYWQSVFLTRGQDVPQDKKDRAKELLADAAKLAGDSPLGDRIAAPEFEKDRLQIGMEAPDIVGEDLDGAQFKLSDYRGKVVVLDFWGFW